MQFGGILDVIFPKRCVSCRAFGQYLCSKCQAKMIFLTDTICPICERAAIGGATHPGCSTRYGLDGLISFYRYEGVIKAAIKRLKYKPYLGELAEILLRQVDNKVLHDHTFTILPVPLHPKRFRQRGFNQAHLIGKAIGKRLLLPLETHVLQRTRYTTPQVALKGEDRRTNLLGAFAVTAGSVVPHETLLIDDVWTTGSTLQTCANVLKRAGAKKVWALTIAR